jgi:hypothetical protein
MNPPTINPDEMLKSMAAEAVKQHKQIRTTIRDLTLEALQMRELSLNQIKSVVRKVTEGVNVGVGGGKIDVEKALSDAFAGMDEALLKVVEANNVALQKLTEGGASFEETSVKKGLKELETFEEKFLDGVKQAAQEASERTKQQWKSILDKIPRGGTDTGARVEETLSAHAREAQAAMRSSREAGLKIMHTLTQNYATLVSGVLIGLSEALEQGKHKTKR